MITAIRKSGESAWEGTPSKRFWDKVEAKQESKDSEFLRMMQKAITEIDEKRNKVFFTGVH